MPCHICEDAICDTPFVSQKLVFSAQLFGTWRPEGCCTTWEVHRWKAMGISDVTGKLQPLANWTTWHLWNMEMAKQKTWAKDFSQHHVVHFITSVYPSSVLPIKIPMGLKSTASSQWHWVGWPEIYASSQHVWKSPSTIIATSFVSNQFNRNELKLYKWTPSKTTTILFTCWILDVLKISAHLYGIWLLQHLSCPTPVGSSGTDCPGPSLKGNKKRQHIFHTFAVVARKYLFEMVGWNAPAFFFGRVNIKSESAEHLQSAHIIPYHFPVGKIKQAVTQFLSSTQFQRCIWHPIRTILGFTASKLLAYATPPAFK